MTKCESCGNVTFSLTEEGKKAIEEYGYGDEKSRIELAEELYQINAIISLNWIGMKKTPTAEAISYLNKRLGEIIKDLRG